MKKLMKKGLSLFLAVLMVVSMLPVDALAAAFLDGEDTPARVEEPVLDVGEAIVDTHAGTISRDDREAVETPDPGIGDGDDKPVDPLWANLPLAFEIDNYGNFTVSVTGTEEMKGKISGNWGLVVTFDGAANGGTPAVDLIGGDISGNTSDKSKMDTAMESTGLPGNLFSTNGGASFNFSVTDGSYDGRVLRGSLGGFNDFMREVQKIDSSLVGATEIPLRIILVTQQNPPGVSQMEYKWQLTGGHLKDATYTLDLRTDPDPSLTTPGTTWVDADGSGTFTVPIENDGTMDVTMGEYIEGSNDNGYEAPSTGGTSVSAPGSYAWNITIPDTSAAGFAVYEIPYSYTDGTDEVTGTATITIVVINDDTPLAVSATGVTFRVKEGFTDSVTAAFGVTTPDSAVTAIATADIGDMADADGYGLRFNPPTVEGADHENGGYLIYVTEDYGDELSIGTTPYTTITLTPDGSGLVADGGVETTYTTTMPFNVWDQNGGMAVMNVKVTIIVEPGEVEEISTVEFNAKDGSATDTQTGTPGTAATAPSGYTANTTKKTISGQLYIFKGWSATEVAPGNTATITNTFTFPAADTTQTYYGVWAKMFSVTYQNSSTSGHPSITAPSDTSSPYETGSAVTVLGATGLSVGDERDGTDGKVYKFLGWDMGGAKYYPGETNASFTISADTTLTASWEEVKYTVKYDMNGVTATNASVFGDETLSNGANTTKAATEPLAAGKTFTGWKISESKSVSKGNQYTVAKADADEDHVITLVAQWGDQTRTVTYSLNGKTFAESVLKAPAAETVTYGGDVDPLSTAISTSTNYVDTDGKGWTFKGWGPATNTAAADAITKVPGVTENTTVYAIWAPTMHTVTYAVGSAGTSGTVTGSGATVQVQHGDTHTVGTDVTLAAADGVTDWKPQSTPWDRTGSIKVEDAVTITGQWQVMVSFDADTASKDPAVANPTNMPDAQWVNVGGKATKPATNPASDNWNFQQWVTASKGSTQFDFNTAITAPTTIYAKWGEKPTTAIFYLNNGDKWKDDATDASITATGTPGGDATPGAGKTPPVRADYTFGGWATSSGGTTAVDPKYPAAGATDANKYWAIWTRDQSNIKFVFGNGAEDKTETGDTKAELAVAKFPDDPSRANYRFDKWLGDDGKTYSKTSRPSFPATKNATLTITAQWVGQSTVTFDLNGGTLADGKTIPSSQTGDVGTGIGTKPTAVAAGDVTKTGYTFAGWALNKNNAAATDAVNVDNITYPATVNTTATYYAIWTINQYDLIYDLNGHGTTAMQPVTTHHNYNTSVTPGSDKLVANTTTDTDSNGVHWVFKGWYKETGCTNAATAFNITADTTVYAKWEQDTHTLTYNANGGAASSVPTAVSDIVCGTEVDVDKTTTPTYDANHRFLGWDTNSSATTPTYAAGAGGKITVTGPTTLYAVWEAVVNVTWKTNGGTWSTAQGGGQADKTQTGVSGATMTTYTGGTDVTYAGYRFKDWTNDPSSGKLPATDTTYTARWDRLYNVVFDVNAPDGATDITVTPATVAKVTDKIVGEKAENLAALSDTQGNYVFKGWAKSTDGSVACAAGSDYTVAAADASGTDDDNAKITLYGVWVKKTKATFDLNGGEWTVAADIAEAGDKNTNIIRKGDPGVDALTAPTNPQKEGYDFNGWSPSVPAKFPDADTTYTAQWKVKQYTVSFLWNTTAHSHTAEEVFGTSEGNFGAVITLPEDNPPSMEGYTFGGWYTQADCADGKELLLTGDDAATYPANNTTKFYAKWTANQYKIIYNINGGGGADAYIDVDDGTDGNQTEVAFTYAADPAKKAAAGSVIKDVADGWTFTGWSTTNGVQTVVYAANAELPTKTTAGNINLYAQWTVDVTFHGNPPTGTTVTDPGTKTTTPGGTLAAANYNAPATLTDYTFAGWFDTAAATGGTEYKAASTYPAPKDLYARWTPVKYTYTFDPNGGAFPDGTQDISTEGGVGTAIPGPNDGADEPKTVNPVWQDHTFKGWNAVKANASAGTADAGLPDATMPSGGKTIYAAWTENTYGYKFDPNNGTFPSTVTPEADGTYIARGKAGATVTAPTDPTYTDDGGRHYRFDGWFTAADDTGTKVTAPYKITGNSTDGAVTDTVYAHWTPLYTITYDPGTDFTATITQPSGVTTTPGVPNGTYNAATPYNAAGDNVALVAATGGSWDGTTRFNTADNKHWKFEGWTPDGGTTLINAGGNVTIDGADVTLTAVWTQQYKVTMKAAVRPDGTTASDGKVGGKLNGSSNPTYSYAATPYIYVSAAFGVADAQLLNNSDQYVFVKWKASNTGSFALGDGETGSKLETTNATDTFTPTADTELTPVFAKKPGLTPAVNGYQLNFATDASVGATEAEQKVKWQFNGNAAAGQPATGYFKATNTLPKYEWNAGDATIGDVTIQKVGDSTVTTLTDGNQYTYNSTTGEIEFQRAYLLTLGATQDYTVTVNYTLNGTAGTNTAKLWAVVTPDQLTKVEIGVKPDTAADYEAAPVVNATPETDRTKSASVTVEERNQVKYLDHKATTIVPGNKLTYQWYYAPGASTPGYHTAVGNLTLPANAVAIGSSTTDNFVAMDNDDYKGKYIFATVVATGTGYGAVVTNSIPVDYDAVIKVNKDGAADTTDGRYTVYLVPRVTGTTNENTYNATALAPRNPVATTHTDGTNQYATATSALTGGVTYDVYVNRLEGDSSLFVKTGKAVSTQTAATAAPELNFYSVNAVDTQLDHKKDNNNEYVGESFGTDNADVPVTEFYAEGITAKFDSGKGVFDGTKVTAKASKTWTQDYDVNWGMKEDAGADAPTLPYGTDNQVAANAKNTGKDYTDIDAKTWIGIQLEQNVYDITGKVWVNDPGKTGNAGIVASGDDLPTLTYKNDATGKTYLFKATVDKNGVHTSTITFAGVPKSSMAEGGAITGKYVVEATAKPSNTKSTIKKYVVGGTLPNTGNTANDDNTVGGWTGLTDRTLAADVVAGGVTGSMFTVVVEGSTYSLKAADQELSATQKSAIHTLSGTPTVDAPTAPSGGRLATQPWTGTYAGITAKTYTIDVTNEGNMPLDVTLNILRTMGTDNVYVYGPSKAGTDDLTAPHDDVTVWTDEDNKVTFGALQETFTLAAKGDAAGKDKVTFTITVPADLAVNNAADYAFELTSKEGELYGPSVTYKLTQKVSPLPITDIQVQSAGDNAWSPKSLAINGSTTIPSGVNETNEVEYKWYVAPTSTSNVAINTAGTGTLTGTDVRAATASGVSGNTYTLAAADQGMSLYLVAHNKGTGNITEADFVKVADLPYDLEIQVNEDDTATANKGNYTVYLWPSDGSTINLSTAISATATAAADGRYKATGLVPGTTYDIYTNAVGGTADHYQKSGTKASLTDFTGKNVPVVTYRSVTLNNTTTDNDPYSFDDTTAGTTFFKDVDGTTTTLDGGLQKPTATLKGQTTKVADPDVAASNWVQQGTKITVTYPKWEKDYTLSWDVGADVTNAAADAEGDVTMDASKTIDSQLKLNLYDVPVYALGSGVVTEITLTGNGMTFTTQATGEGKVNGVGETMGNISASEKGNPVTFSVPKGEYTVAYEVANGTTKKGVRVPHDETAAVPDTPADMTGTVNTADADKDDADVMVTATGQFLNVTDNAKTVDDTTSNKSGTASFTEEVGNDTVNQTITLPYGYDDASYTLTIKNASDTTKETIFDVNMTDTGFPIDEKVTFTKNGSNPMDKSANMEYTDEATTVTVSIAKGLAAGDHTGTLTFSFNHVDGNDTEQPTVTYNLTVTVEPTKFTEVTVVDGDNATVTDVALGKDLKFATYTTSTVDDWTNGKHLTADEYTYQWYHGPADKIATESWDATNGTVSVTDATAIDGATAATLPAAKIAEYPGKHIYLVISAVKDTNVIEAAISAPITTGFQPVVKVAVDGTDQADVEGFDGTGYTVTIDDGTTTLPTAWDTTAGGFVPVNNTTDKVKVSLDATKEYTASVSRIQGDSANLVALDDKLSNTSTTNTVTAEYFTVNTVETKAFEGITGLGEDFGGDDKLTGPAVSLTLTDNTALTTGTPVLKDQSVVAKAATWTQDYELTWYTRMDGDATVPTRDTAYEGTTPAMTARGGKVDATSATGTGYTVSKVTNKLYVGGRLDQITYTVIGTVAGTGTVASVALEQTDPKAEDYIYPDTGNANPLKPDGSASVTDTSSDTANKTLSNGETVTFTVVKGTFTITPTEGANTVIDKVSWEGTEAAAGVTVLENKTVQLKDTDPKRTYNFVVTVKGADIKLKVSDDVATPNTTAAESTPNAWNDAKNGVERYFNYLHFKKTDSTAADTYEYELTLTNAGNKDVLVNAEVYHFAAAPASGFGADADTWAATVGSATNPGTKVYETANGATATLTGDSTKTVLSLADMLAANTKVAAKSPAGADGSAKAGKITLGTDAWAKDSGAYVFHFMGVTDDADKVPVDVYYVLDLKVNQLPIVGVASNNDGTSMPGVGDTLTVKGYDATAASDKSLENVTVQTSTQTSQTTTAAGTGGANLTNDDVHFAWVKVSASTTLTKKDITDNTTVNTSGELTTAKDGWTITQGKTYTLVDGDQDHNFYLVAFAPNYTGNKTNATDLAVASVVKAKRTAGVKVSLNGFDVTGTTDPGYKVYLVESTATSFDKDHTDGSTGTWATTWNDTTNRYEAAIDVDNKTYDIYAVTYKGGSTIINAIGGTLGKQSPTGTKTEETVPYWNVTFTEDVAVTSTRDGFKSYLPNGDAGTTNAIQEALSVKVSTTKGGTTYETNALTASTTSTNTTVPVLEGMNVQVTVNAKKSSANTTDGVKKSWSESDVQSLHTLTAMGTGWTDSATNKSSGIGYADSIVSNAVKVETSAKTFSAKLDQVLFDVEFTVKDISEDDTGAASPSTRTKVRQVTLAPDTGRGETGSYNATSAVGEYGNTDKVTISGVPAGNFTVKATAVPGTPTLVKGYTWNDAPDPISTDGKIVVVVGGATPDTTNKHTGNTIQIIEATKVVNWSHTFDDATGGVLADGAFELSNGFVKADDTAATPKKLFGLTEGYTKAGGAVLEYTVRVANGGTDDMTGFYLTRSGDSDFEYDLSDVTWYHKTEGGYTKTEHHNALNKFTFGPEDYLEFTVTIPEGQAAKRDNYKTEIVPHCDLNTGETLGGGNYAPEYQVKSPVKFKPGEALVLYGGSDFESNTDIALDWPATTDEAKPTFTYEVLALDGTNDAAILKEINDALSLSLTTLDPKPTWLTHDGNTGAITIPTGAHVNTNVKVKGAPADFDAYDVDANGHKVNNEVTLYLRATDTKTALTYVIPYVVDVEPGQLNIDNSANFAPTDPVGGQKVDKSEFTYLKVFNQATAPLDVVPALDAGAKRTGAGNDPVAANAGNGKVYVNDGTNNVHTASWSVTPTEYVSDVATEYAFTVTYKPDDPVQKWNYKPDTYKKTLTANRPPLGLTFGDVLGVSSIEPAGAELKLGRAPDAGYSDIKTDAAPFAPAAMDDTPETFRKGEYLVYLDTEPRYTVTLTATGDLKDVTWTETLNGFQVVPSASGNPASLEELKAITTLTDGQTVTFALELSETDPANHKWVGDHTAAFTVEGTSTDGKNTTSATYTVELKMDPKVIAQAHVTDLDDPTPGTTPDTTITVTAKDPEDKDIKPSTPDKHGNTPIVPVVTWTDPQGNPVDPTKPFEDDKDYKVKVDLPADPNYTFEDLTEPEEEPNYTLNGKTDVNGDPTLMDEDLTITVTSENDPPVPDRNKQVTFEKTTELPKFAHLEFEDMNADNAADNMPHAVNVERPTITVKRGDALGKYIISLGAYDNAVTDVEVTQVNGLPAGAVWSLTPDAIDRLEDVTATPAGEKQSYTLDMSGVYTVDLDAKIYTLELTAVGQDANYPERTVPAATYKITVQVLPADPSVLMFKDLLKEGTGTGTTNVITPKENEYAVTYTRDITVKWDKDKGWWSPLGTYNIDLGAFTNNVSGLSINTQSDIPSDSILKLGADAKDFGLTVGKLDAGATWPYALDLSDVDYSKLDTAKTYELLMTATGKDLNGATVTATYKLTFKLEEPPKPELKFDDVKVGTPTDTTGPEVNDTRTITTTEGSKLGKYIIYLGAYNAGVKVTSITSTRSANLVYDVTPDCTTLTPTLVERKNVDDAQAFELDLTGMVTKPGTYTLTLNAQGVDMSGKYTVNASYTLTITIRPKGGGGGGGGGGTSCPNQVTYLLGLYGTTKDATMEMVNGKTVKSVPNVSALEGYKFLGWSLTGPSGNAEQDAKRTLVDPRSVTINGDTTFYAVYQVLYKVPQPPLHKHYVIGYPNGNFGPADNIDRASVATIIARAVLPNFVEGADYGNPGGYSDVNGHWAASAIAYCSKYGVFKGYDDGTFKPSQPISRQELALVMARIGGIKKGSAPFSDISDAGDWAKDGIYTAYANGWVNGYTDGTFKPLNPIRRDETVKIFNAYLGRGVDAEGLSALTEYVHSGVASNVTENGTSEYMTWPDVTKDQWAYYEIIEAANDHEFAVDATQPRGYAVPETWTKCWIDEKWRYHDDANDGGPNAVVSALTRKFSAAD